MLENLSRGTYNNGDAKTWFRKLQWHHRNSFWLNLGAAEVFSQSNRQAAIGYYRAALSIRPDETYVLTNLGSLLLQEGELDSAFDAYKHAISIFDRNVFAWVGLGNVSFRKKNINDAIKACKKAIKTNPKYATAWNNLAATFFADKKLPEANKAVQKALEVDRNYQSAWLLQSKIFLMNEDLKNAFNSYKMAFDIDRTAAVYVQFSLVYDRMRDFKQALYASKKATELAPIDNCATNATNLTTSRVGPFFR